jgi:MFS family permease
VGGPLTSGLDWRWIFLINLPLGLLCLQIVRRYVVESLVAQPMLPLRLFRNGSSAAPRWRRSGSPRRRIGRGTGGDQVIVDDPSGNPVELFASKR